MCKGNRTLYVKSREFLCYIFDKMCIFVGYKLSSIMEIVCSTDNCYVMQTGIMLTSLFENNREADIRVHVLHNGIDSNSIMLIERIASDYGQKITFYHVDESLFSAFPIGRDGQNSHVGTSYATYYRLFLSELLPNDINRVLYLDGDIIVMDSLNDLWAKDMHDKAIAAVPDSYNNKIEHYNRLRYPQQLGYFNAGVLLINLDYWRTNNVVSAFSQYASARPDSLYCHDQDILNYVFRDCKIVLPLRYNMLNEYWFQTRHSVVSWEFESQMLYGQQHPAIIHFTGLPKPWFSNCRHPMKREFERYRAMTPWRDVKERKWGDIKHFIEHIAQKLLVLSGMRKADFIEFNKYVKL